MFPGTHAALTPDKPALVMAETGETVTYAQLEERSVRLAHLLHDLGLRRGDTVALLSENSPRVHECYWAAMRSGLYLTVVNTHLSVEEQAYIVRDCGAQVLVVSAALGEVAEQLAAEPSEVRERFAFGGAVAGHRDLAEAMAASSDVAFDVQPAGQDMLYSSGTTGRPKAIRTPLPDRQVTEPGDLMLAVFAPMYSFGPDTVYLSPAPLYHAAPLRFCGLITATGGTAVIMSRFDPERALRLVEEHRVTHSQWVPTMFVRMLKLPAEVRERWSVASMRVAIHAAAPCPVEVKRRMIEWWGPVLHEYYASTEAAGITLIDSAQWLERPGSVGRAGLGVLHVCDEASLDAEEPPTGEVGLVYFEREVMPFSYLNDPEKTREAQHPHHDNWATTGDIGRVDDEGYLYLTDRRAFTIISGGVNIYPQEVENALTLHPAVHDVAVIGLPDEEMGEQVRAVVQVAEGVHAGPELAEELMAHVRARIAHFKAPRAVDFVDSLPRTPTGKLVKRRLRESYLTQEVTP